MKKTLLIIFSLILCVHPVLVSQTTFQEFISGPSVGRLRSAIQTSDNNFILTGDGLGTSGHEGIFIAKLNSFGDTLWTRSYALDTGSQNSSHAKSIIETSDGGLFITGYTHAFSSNFRFCILRTDSVGDTLWTRTVQHAMGGHNYGYAGQQTSDGNFVAFGRQGVFNVDFFLNKFDASGILLWTKSYDLQGEFDFGNYVEETFDHGFIMGGNQNDVSNQEIIIIKADSSGGFLWGKKYFGGVGDVCNVVRQTFDGGYLVAGTTQSFGAGYNDILVIKTNSAGDTVWTRAFGTPGNDECTSFRQTPDQGYILTGTTMNPSTGYEQYLLLKLDMNGNLMWSKEYGFGTLAMTSYDVAITNDNGFLICGNHGFVVKTDEFGNSCNETTVTLSVASAPLVISSIIPTTVSSASLGHATLLYKDNGATIGNQCLDLGIGSEPNNHQIGLDIYPNPATEKIEIDLHDDLFNGRLYLFDITGNKVFEMTLGNESRQKLDIRSLSPGAYMILVKGDRSEYTGKFIRQ